MAKCSLCGGKADKDDICYGCDEIICELCDRECGIPVPHLFEEHLEVKKARAEERTECPLLQQIALKEAWQKGAEIAKIDIKICKFKRGLKAGGKT